MFTVQMSYVGSGSQLLLIVNVKKRHFKDLANRFSLEVFLTKRQAVPYRCLLP